MRLRFLHPTLTLTALSAILMGSGPAPTGGEPDAADTTQARPMTTSEKIRAARLNIQLTGDPVAGALALANEQFQASESEMRVERVQKDELGFTHVRMKQYYKGVPVEGTDVVWHVTGQKVVYHVQGRTLHNLLLDVRPVVTKGQAISAAVHHALDHKCTDGECRQWVERDSLERAWRVDIEKDERDIVSVHEPALLIYNKRLVYSIIVRERGADFADWEYWVDAKTGQVVQRHNTIDYWGTPPSASGYDTTVTGVKLAHEVNPATNDSVVTMTGWRDTGAATDHHYFLYYKGNDTVGPWAVYDLHEHPCEDTCNGDCQDSADTCCDWEQRETYDWSTSDRFAVSAGKNLEYVQRWLADTLGRNSFDNNGARVRAYIRVQQGPPWSPYKNTAGWMHLDTAIYVGDGDGDTFVEIASLDAFAHEIGHGLTRSTSDLFRGGSGEGPALNESYSDIMGVSVEFAYQADSTSAYPDHVPGTADWLLGEDVLQVGGPYKAIRDFMFAYRAEQGGDLAGVIKGRAVRYDGTYFRMDTLGNTTNEYDRMGVQNLAFYLLAEGATADTIDGHPHGTFSGIGVAAASRVAMKANTVYATPWMTYQDMPRIWALAAQDLVDSNMIPADAVEAVDSAWSSVDVGPELRLLNPAGQTVIQFGRYGNLKLLKQHDAASSGEWSVLKMRAIHTASADTSFGFRADGSPTLIYGDTLVQNDSAFVDTAGLAGSLVVRGPSGSPLFVADSFGCLRIRGRAWPQALHY